MPALEVLIGYGSIIVTALLSVASYWYGFLYPASTLFGYGLLIFSINVLFWIVRSRYELKQVKSANMGSLFKLTYDLTLRKGAREKQMLDDLRCLNGNLEIALSCQEPASTVL